MRRGNLLKKPIKETLHAKGMEISIYSEDFQTEFISLTDIASYKSDEPNDVIKNWMRNRDTIKFLGLWESLYNPDLKPVEFDRFLKRGWIKCIHNVSYKMDFCRIQTLYYQRL